MHHLATILFGTLAALGGFVHPQVAAPAPLLTDESGTPIHVPIFIYHSIATDTPKETKSQEQFSTDPALLAQQLSYLDAHGYTTVTMQQVADMLRRGTTSPIKNPVALTFDDGWVTQYRYALPLLREHHMKATFYIYPNPIGKDARFMTWDQVKEVQAAGMEIADHSYTHPLLSKLTPIELHHELYDSKTVLEEKLGTKMTDFASPFGYTSPAVVAELKADGYETGRTTNPGFTHTASSTYALDAYLVHKGLKDFEWAVTYGK